MASKTSERHNFEFHPTRNEKVQKPQRGVILVVREELISLKAPSGRHFRLTYRSDGAFECCFITYTTKIPPQ
jgi:hypothetical protein